MTSTLMNEPRQAVAGIDSLCVTATYTGASMKTRKPYYLVHDLLQPWTPKRQTEAANRIRDEHAKAFARPLFEKSYLTDEDRAEINRKITLRGKA